MTPQELDRFLTRLLGAHANVSDIHFTVGRPPQIEVEGSLHMVQGTQFGDNLEDEDTRAIGVALLDDRPDLLEALQSTGSVDCGYTTQAGQRLRANIFKARGRVSIVLRAFADQVPALDQLGLPPIVEEIPELANGMVLVTGGTGAGKSTTLAAVIDRINRTRPAHVVSLEDPIEFVHPHRRSTINQRELGADFPDFHDGLRMALRQSPKVIMVGEMRDRESLQVALRAAETGQLVLSSLHTIDAGQTIDRIIAMFPEDAERLVRERLSHVLRFVISQRLVPAEGGGRVPAVEIMGNSMRVRELIQRGETPDSTFRQVIIEAAADGWQTFDHHLVSLFDRGVISEETAMAHCTDRSFVTREIDEIRKSTGQDTSNLGELEMAYIRPLRKR